MDDKSTSTLLTVLSALLILALIIDFTVVFRAALSAH
jgi:hypothetical protein